MQAFLKRQQWNNSLKFIVEVLAVKKGQRWTPAFYTNYKEALGFSEKASLVVNVGSFSFFARRKPERCTLHVRNDKCDCYK